MRMSNGLHVIVVIVVIFIFVMVILQVLIIVVIVTTVVVVESSSSLVVTFVVDRIIFRKPLKDEPLFRRSRFAWEVLVCLNNSRNRRGLDLTFTLSWRITVQTSHLIFCLMGICCSSQQPTGAIPGWILLS